ncbi:MAG: hypothetical protein V1813_00135 [Candidatus Aenigmatarchaeota archaeon]
MTGIDDHKRRINEHISALKDAFDAGLSGKPVTVGFHCSACAVEMLEFYLHKSQKIDAGRTVKHDWFKRPAPGQKTAPLVERNMPVSFPRKDEVYGLIYTIEENRNMLVYGKSLESQVRTVFESFMKLKGILAELLDEEGETIG